MAIYKHKDGFNTDENMAFSSKREMTVHVFEIQTRTYLAPGKRASTMGFKHFGRRLFLRGASSDW